MDGVKIGAISLAIATVVFCVVRGIPVIIEGIRFFREDFVLPRVW
jgi:hypothetical protein